MKDDFKSILIRLERVLQILKEEGHPIEQQKARRAELCSLVRMIKNAEYC